jgi:hypothetical protein
MKNCSGSGMPNVRKEAESSGHSLWWFDASKEVWAECSRRIQKCMIEEEIIYHHFREVERPVGAR